MQPEAATVSITRHLDLRPSFGAAGKKSPTAGGDRGAVMPIEGQGRHADIDVDGGTPPSILCDPRTPNGARSFRESV